MTTAAYCFKIESCEENLYCFFPQRWTERGCCSSPLVERHHCNLAYQFEESLIYQLYTMAKEMHMVQLLLFSLFRHSMPSWKNKKKRWHSSGFNSSILLSTKDNMHLLIGEAKYKLAFKRWQKTFCMQNSKTCYRLNHDNFSAKQLCHVIVEDECHSMYCINTIE